jgi:hypothetical protein
MNLKKRQMKWLNQYYVLCLSPLTGTRKSSVSYVNYYAHKLRST